MNQQNPLHMKKPTIRIFLIIVSDILLASVAFLCTYSWFTSYRPPLKDFSDTMLLMLVFDVIMVSSLAVTGNYRKKVIASWYLYEPLTFLASAMTTFICSAFFKLIDANSYGWCIIVGIFSFLLLSASRLLQKLSYDYYFKRVIRDRVDYIPTLIIGAGFTGKMICAELNEFPESNHRPVCFVDDNKDLISTTIYGIPVYGPAVLIPELVKKYKIGLIVLAIPSCTPEQRRHILENCQELNCDVRVVPSLGELTGTRAFFKQAQPVDVEKLLGRDAINIENNHIREFIENKVVLVTGGGGSIGSELCRQIVRMKPKSLVILDIYENNAYAIQQELHRAGFGEDVVSVEIASVRDLKKLRVLFEKYRFNVVFHAAAHKHVPLMEHNPEEAVKNNITGTYNVAHLAHLYEAEKMVLISTDKAVNPTNVMGASKRMCEMVMQYMAQTYTKTKFTAVRFGNVLGSNGSVIPLFTKQIEAGGPVTVTHPDIIRYFMTIPEAVSLVLEAGTMSSGGEIFVLDMGKPVKIVTLAENLIKMYGYEPYTQMKIEFCGLRPGEKLFEELLMDEENLKETYNKKIFINDQIEIDADIFKDGLAEIFNAAKNNNSDLTVKLLHKFVPTFKSPEEVNRNSILKQEQMC